jgi:hypothetical protein
LIQHAELNLPASTLKIVAAALMRDVGKQWRMHLRLTLLVLTLCLPLIAAAESPVSPTSIYRILERVPGPNGDWDYAIVDPEARHMYLARTLRRAGH